MELSARLCLRSTFRVGFAYFEVLNVSEQLFNLVCTHRIEVRGLHLQQHLILQDSLKVCLISRHYEVMQAFNSGMKCLIAVHKLSQPCFRVIRVSHEVLHLHQHLHQDLRTNSELILEEEKP